jgi:Protein of unknown function (DUF2934)
MSSNPKGSEGAEASVQTGQTPTGSAEEEERIRCRAYEICLERGGEPGHELDDWLQAARELQTLRVL